MAGYQTTVTWKGGMAFESVPPSGNPIFMDAGPDDGGEGQGPTPVETLLSAVAGCAGMDVIMILRKKKQVVTSYRVEVDGERNPPGSTYPRPFLSITVRHIVTGENIDPVALERAVSLSDEKYCTVITTLRAAPEVKSEWVIE